MCVLLVLELMLALTGKGKDNISVCSTPRCFDQRQPVRSRSHSVSDRNSCSWLYETPPTGEILQI